ncbi:cytochrome C biogenesis protein [Halogeometricum borinquense]|uniref:Cytochrome C biogenesis protein n=1 Tax=Halogeometricum borinquense TaxID=60847 RepID=A0A6C0UEI7_9EURY|nr:cytochrome c biogenesis protein CcdA [Halogeometricum borinquense]QIB73844.1 cytochrome C biogenesis protein [Halogeometricum borinquense]QIQ76793.1 cytochrome C biogenesis protein [Halogeometricum borinquense]
MQMVASGAFAGTVAFAVSAGAATFLAPCAYPLLPGYISYYVGRDDSDTGGAIVRGTAAAIGALVVLVTVAGVLFTAGTAVVSHLTLLEPIIGVALIVLGALFALGHAPTLHMQLPERRSSVGGFAVFGGVYALAAAGCVVPVFVGVVTQSLTLSTGKAAVVLLAYALSVAVPLAAVTVLGALGSYAFRGLSKYIGSVQRIAGVVMVLAGLWQVVISLQFLGWV